MRVRENDHTLIHITSKTAQIKQVEVSLCSVALALSPVLMASTYVFGDAAAAAATSEPRPSAEGLNMLSTGATKGKTVGVVKHTCSCASISAAPRLPLAHLGL